MDEQQQDEPDAVEHATPRWVKGFIATGVIVALVVVVLVLLGDDHGPGRHDLGSGPSPVVPLRS
ncbi:MAG: hypothetical protein KY460_16665 [Actinobacteria bacterium]|nr:hypothetical protein [Actinomycetota bacterium]